MYCETPWLWPRKAWWCDRTDLNFVLVDWMTIGQDLIRIGSWFTEGSSACPVISRLDMITNYRAFYHWSHILTTNIHRILYSRYWMGNGPFNMIQWLNHSKNKMLLPNKLQKHWRHHGCILGWRVHFFYDLCFYHWCRSLYQFKLYVVPSWLMRCMLFATLWCSREHPILLYTLNNKHISIFLRWSGPARCKNLNQMLCMVCILL